MCSKNCADLPIAPIKRNNEISVIRLISNPKKVNISLLWLLVSWKTSSKFIVPKNKNIKKIPIANPKSPILFTIKAFIAALLADSFLYQKPINR